MKKLSVFVLGLSATFFMASAHAADFFSYHDALFRSQSLCHPDADQVKEEREFKRMYLTLKRDDARRRRSVIEIADYLAYSTTLRNTASRAECTVNQHDGCYTTYCNF